ncbi:hypothetical protein EJ06DRAFT_580840 [Trichodelitschia bisporula]|uniref:Uncharacterized protein n=1 Tax=Trichodelitschia bisporula TaxID=703511 RepID=A0A6G1I3J8_9PEZI|nr:hypothetical protein EJ06DRAFT_580840 [Trichodelitschia bisporula]
MSPSPPPPPRSPAHFSTSPAASPQIVHPASPAHSTRAERSGTVPGAFEDYPSEPDPIDARDFAPPTNPPSGPPLDWSRLEPFTSPPNNLPIESRDFYAAATQPGYPSPSQPGYPYPPYPHPDFDDFDAPIVPRVSTPDDFFSDSTSSFPSPEDEAAESRAEYPRGRPRTRTPPPTSPTRVSPPRASPPRIQHTSLLHPGFTFLKLTSTPRRASHPSPARSLSEYSLHGSSGASLPFPKPAKTDAEPEAEREPEPVPFRTEAHPASEPEVEPELEPVSLAPATTSQIISAHTLTLRALLQNDLQNDPLTTLSAVDAQNQDPLTLDPLSLPPLTLPASKPRKKVSLLPPPLTLPRTTRPLPDNYVRTPYPPLHPLSHPRLSRPPPSGLPFNPTLPGPCITLSIRSSRQGTPVVVAVPAPQPPGGLPGGEEGREGHFEALGYDDERMFRGVIGAWKGARGWRGALSARGIRGCGIEGGEEGRAGAFLEGLRYPRQGRGREGWVRWVRERGGVRVELVEGVSNWKVLGGVGGVILLAVLGAVVWVVLGRGGGRVEGRVGAGMAVGGLVCLLGFGGVAGWVVGSGGR